MGIKPITVKIEDHSQEVMNALQNALERGAMSIGETAVKHAKDKITEQKAVDTGRLRNSITYMVQQE